MIRMELKNNPINQHNKFSYFFVWIDDIFLSFFSLFLFIWLGHCINSRAAIATLNVLECNTLDFSRHLLNHLNYIKDIQFRIMDLPCPLIRNRLTACTLVMNLRRWCSLLCSSGGYVARNRRELVLGQSSGLAIVQVYASENRNGLLGIFPKFAVLVILCSHPTKVTHVTSAVVSWHS